jgi:hypothetical protein
VDLVRPFLHEEGSMRTRETLLTPSPDSRDLYQVRMTFSALNALGGRQEVVAVGGVQLAADSMPGSIRRRGADLRIA